MPKTRTNNWSKSAGQTIGLIKNLLAYLSIDVRTKQINWALKKFKINNQSLAIDVGTSPDETLVDTNIFEKIYPYPKNLTIASVEDCRKLVKKFNLKKFFKIEPGRYPFKSKEFDLVASIATLEHVGGRTKQAEFLKELDRIGKNIFLTTPYKYCFYEPHSGLFFLHWLPDQIWRKILRFLRKNFWADEKNLRLLSLKEAKEILPNKKYKIKIFYLFKFIPSHLLIYKKC